MRGQANEGELEPAQDFEPPCLDVAGEVCDVRSVVESALPELLEVRCLQLLLDFVVYHLNQEGSHRLVLLAEDVFGSQLVLAVDRQLVELSLWLLVTLHLLGVGRPSLPRPPQSSGVGLGGDHRLSPQSVAPESDEADVVFKFAVYASNQLCPGGTGVGSDRRNRSYFVDVNLFCSGPVEESSVEVVKVGHIVPGRSFEGGVFGDNFGEAASLGEHPEVLLESLHLCSLFG